MPWGRPAVKKFMSRFCHQTLKRKTVINVPLNYQRNMIYTDKISVAVYSVRMKNEG